MARAIAVIHGAETPLGMEIMRRLISENYLVAAITATECNGPLREIEDQCPDRVLRLLLKDGDYGDVLLKAARWEGPVRIVISVTSQEHFLPRSPSPGTSTEQLLAGVAHTTDLFCSAGYFLGNQDRPVRLLALLPPQSSEEARGMTGIIEASLRQMTQALARAFRGQGTAVNLIIAGGAQPQDSPAGRPEEIGERFPDTVNAVSVLSSAEDPWLTGLTFQPDVEEFSTTTSPASAFSMDLRLPDS